MLESLAFMPATLLKKKLQHMRFSVKFAKVLRILFFAEYIPWLLLSV